MDGGRFDDLTRDMAAGLQRRGLLRAALGGLAACFVGVRGAVAQEGNGRGSERRDCPDGCPDGERCVAGACRPSDGVCREDRDCRDEADACIGGTCEEGQCSQFVVDCRPGYLCCNNGECCPQPCTTDIDCFVADPCEVGRCVEGACAFETKDPCYTCEQDADCENLDNPAFCCEGVCMRPCPEGTTLGKGCECVAGSIEDLNANGVSESDDASGSDNAPEQPPADDATAEGELGAEPPAEGEVESADDGSITLGGPISISTSDAPESTITTSEPEPEAAADVAPAAGEGEPAPEGSGDGSSPDGEPVS
jgi:hypothetical protein